jgi:hypothetical protein
MTKELDVIDDWWENDRHFEDVDKTQLTQVGTIGKIFCPKCKAKSASMFSGELMGNFVAQIECPECTLSFSHREPIGKRVLRDRDERGRFDRKAVFLFSEYVDGMVIDYNKRTLIGKFKKNEN